jgi:GTP-binding protein
MFVDTAKVFIEAGKGGNGAVSFRHEIYIPKGGPDGGNGGRGGNVVFAASKDSNTLIDFRFAPELKAEPGKNGSGQQSTGRSGQDLIVEVPVGTVVKRDGKIIADLAFDGASAIVAHGGDGGFGNAHFKSSVRQAPRVAELGEPGDTFEAELELKLLADVGLVGFPNAGKSTFLSVVSNAKPEIADYPFTTLTPNLGVATVDDFDILISDIPGLIEGASEGKGLGQAFLRHIERTSVILHLIDAYSDDAGDSYAKIRAELAKYSPELADRPEIIALTKTEGLDAEILKMQMSSILAKNPKAEIYAISSAAHQGLTEILRALKDKIVAAKAAVQAAQNDNPEEASADKTESDIPVISLPKKLIEKHSFSVQKLEDEDKFVVTGKKIEKFARRTDLNNYDSLNRLRDILKKLGIRAELTKQGATPTSIIEISGKEFTLIEQ